jgi:prepilin-type N-terminal cleavage/methylation domain-containing protein
MRRIGFRGFTLIETTIVMVIVAIIAAAVLPKVMQALVEARETTALQHLRTIHTAQASYFSKYGAFAAKIAQLGPPPNAGLISSDLARGEKMGYRFAIVPAAEGYAVTARPHPVQGSARSFYSDSSLVIRYAEGSQEATPESPSLGRGRLRLGGRVD